MQPSQKLYFFLFKAHKHQILQYCAVKELHFSNSMFLFIPALKDIVQAQREGEELNCITWIRLAQAQTSFYVKSVFISIYEQEPCAQEKSSVTKNKNSVRTIPMTTV